MSNERIYDTSVFKQPADFKLQMEIKKEDYSKDNADGSRPSVTVAVKATDFSTALQVLNALHENEMGEYIETAVSNAPFLSELSEEEVMNWSEELENRMSDYLKETHEEFKSTTLEYEAKDIETQEVLECVVTITAPSIMLGSQIAYAITNRENLNAFASNLMPYASEEDDDL